MTVGEKIKYHRRMLGLNQTELGEKLGVKTNAVSKLECGRVEDIPTSKIKALAALFNVPPSYLLDEEKPPIEDKGLEERDIRLIKWFRSLPPEKQRAILISQDGPEDLAD